jgi:hypothetical protein
MNIISDKSQFFGLIKDFEHVPFVQTEGWCNYHASIKHDSIRYFVDDVQNATIACFGHVKSFMGLKMLIVEGECLKQKTTTAKKIKLFFEGFFDLGYDIIEIDSYLPFQTEFEIGIRQAGFLRPVGMFSIHLSSNIDLTKPVDFNDNWKRNLKIASKSELSFEIINNPTKDDCEEFAKLYKELLEDKEIDHKLSAAEIEVLLSSPNFGLAKVLDNQLRLISAIIFHKSGTHAGLLYASKSHLAKLSGATFFMYKKLLESLSAKGFATFDMERLLPSTHSTNGVFLFKQGIKSNHIIYNGEWSWYKRSIYRPMMYFVKRFLMKKVEV